MCFADPFQGEVLANYAWKKTRLPKSRPAHRSGFSLSVGLAGFFREHSRRSVETIVASQKYSGGDKDLRAQLTVIRAANPDAIFLPGYYVEAGLAAQQAAELGVHATLLGGDGFEAPQLIEIGGAALNGTFYSTHYSAESADPVSQSFVKAYRARHAVFPSDFPT